MRFRIHCATALLCCSAVVAIGRPAEAQSQGTSLLRSAQPGTTSNMSTGTLPTPPAPPMGGGMSGGEVSPGYYMPGMSDMSGEACGCENYCCDQPSCGCSSCDSGGWCGLCGPNGGQFFFTADYLNVRASFSEAI